MKLNLEDSFYMIVEYYGDEFQGFVAIDSNEAKILEKSKDFKSKNKTKYVLIKCNGTVIKTL